MSVTQFNYFSSRAISKKKLSRLAYVSPFGGDNINEVIRKMVFRANMYQIRVACVFNEAQFIVEPGMSTETAYELWDAEMDRKSLQWEKSMKAELYARESKAREQRDVVRRQNVLEMLEKETIQVRWYKRPSFNKAVQLNSKDAYSSDPVNFAIAWAVAMQQEIRNGKKIADVAEVLSREVDYVGITGYMYGWAVAFLSKFWKHGEELRLWHNLDTQIGDEGVKANKKRGAVLNPALLVIGKN